MFPVIEFLMCFALAFFMSMIIVWITSFADKTQKEYENYVNPYRLVPRQEAESYKRYERREYQDSLKNRRKSK
jgi:hypothetical protein